MAHASKTRAPVVESIIGDLPIEDLERLARRYFTPSALRRRRLAERAAAVRALADPSLSSGRAMAAAVARELRRYAAGPWRFERGLPPPADPRRALLHRTLTLGAGNAPSVAVVRRMLSGLGAP